MHWGQQLKRINGSFALVTKLFHEAICRELSDAEAKSLKADATTSPAPKDLAGIPREQFMLGPVVPCPRHGDEAVGPSPSRFRVRCEADDAAVERPVMVMRNSPYPGGGDPQAYTLGGSICRVENGPRARIFDSLMETWFRKEFEVPCEQEGTLPGAGAEPTWAPLFDERRQPPPGLSTDMAKSVPRRRVEGGRVPVLDVSTAMEIWHGASATTNPRHGFHINGNPLQQPMAVQLWLNLIFTTLNRRDMSSSPLPPDSDLPWNASYAC